FKEGHKLPKHWWRYKCVAGLLGGVCECSCKSGDAPRAPAIDTCMPPAHPFLNRYSLDSLVCLIQE
ncbi:hypothetical protein SFRURICE_000997, partial [Spodoptera frugiperda]